VALLSFGGPAGQIAVMHRILVKEKRWIGESRFLHALNYCMLLPGPEAQQLATYVGWLLHRTIGGLLAGTLFVLPGFVSILILSVLYAGFHDITLVQAIFFGVKAAVLAIVIEAVVRISRRALRSAPLQLIAAAAFVAIFFFAVPFPLIIVAAALAGFLGGRLAPSRFLVIAGQAESEAGTPVVDSILTEAQPEHTRPSFKRLARVAAVCLTLWFVPLMLLASFMGSGHVFTQIGLFFSKLAVVTFGGAYAVLAYMAQEVVQNYGWLTPGEMLDGLGMAETTPGPLIMVVQFVAFLGGFREPGTLDPYVAGVLASLLAVWVTFVPCFLWIFAGGPYAERLRGNRALGAALSAITAAVVGVVLNLAVWFSLHVLFGQVEEFRSFGLHLQVPILASIDIASLGLAGAALIALLRFKLGMIPTLGASAALGVLLFYALR
jgi:chromate transporter